MRFAPVLLLLFTCCAASPESEETDAPPWGWTEISADLPDSFYPIERAVIADTRSARELHFAIEMGDTRAYRMVFVTVYEQPSALARMYRLFRFGDVPGAANPGNSYVYSRTDPASLHLPDGLRDATDAWRMGNAEHGEAGVVVQRCEAALCTEVLVSSRAEDGASVAANADLLATLTIRR
ncbi:MAG: hypothetical protein AAGI52_13545 [Bacteroidota bacterium]